jgi:hypothetical protein
MATVYQDGHCKHLALLVHKDAIIFVWLFCANFEPVFYFHAFNSPLGGVTSPQIALL